MAVGVVGIAAASIALAVTHGGPAPAEFGPLLLAQPTAPATVAPSGDPGVVQSIGRAISGLKIVEARLRLPTIMRLGGQYTATATVKPPPEGTLDQLVLQIEPC